MQLPPWVSASLTVSPFNVPVMKSKFPPHLM